ncbi:MAG: hypothetical protein OXD50_07285 [Chloroflexi bacterium]|nr:hypothetical protein [Chloroflexota bacterium]
MSRMNPILRLRRLFRQVGAQPREADELSTVLDEIYLSRQEFEERIARLMAENRNQSLLGVLIIVGIGVGVLALVN